MEQNSGGHKRFESHASWMTNQRMNLLYAQIDQVAPRAGQTMKLSDIQQYFLLVKQVFMNVKDVLSTAAAVQDLKDKYEYVLGCIETNPGLKGYKALRLMLQITDEMYSQVIQGMQEWGYFYRVGSYQKKGLKNIRFFDDSIFSGGKHNGGTDELNPGLEPEEENI